MERTMAARFFENMRYGCIARAISRLNRTYRFTGSPEFRPVVRKAAEKASVVSISPHPDDDILAVGGALAGHITAGGAVQSIVWTDGARGTTDASPSIDTLVRARRVEVEKAASVLGVTSIDFYNETDGNLRPADHNINLLIDTIRRVRPDYIYTPFPIDYHFDHIAATEIVIMALRNLDHPPLVRGYESIIPLLPNLILDITDHIDLKRRAVACFVSQNAVSDYSRTIVEGLNRHRSYGEMAGKGYGEAIFESGWRIFNEILHIVHGKRLG
jgi:LmbE family N-acetylglucosaminyl deacetylase